MHLMTSQVWLQVVQADPESEYALLQSKQVIKLSDAVQDLPRQATQYVHGAPDCFLRIGDDAARPEVDGEPRFSKGAYTLGKMVWGKVPIMLPRFPG